MKSVVSLKIIYGRRFITPRNFQYLEQPRKRQIKKSDAAVNNAQAITAISGNANKTI